MLDGEARYADYVSGGNNDKSVVFEYVVQEGDEGQIAYRGPKIISDENGSVRNEAGLSVSAIDTQVDFGYIGVDPSYVRLRQPAPASQARDRRKHWTAIHRRCGTHSGPQDTTAQTTGL